MTVVDLLVWIGTLTFAATGALAGVQRRFDLVGVLVLASVTAVGGGAVRDVTVGRLPPSTFTNEPLLWAVAATGLAVFLLHGVAGPAAAGLRRASYVSDALGLAIFATLGALTGFEAGLGPWGCLFAGAVSGVGGGVLRDVLAGQVPGILYRNGDFYASAAAIGAFATWAAAQAGATDALTVTVGTVTVLTVRFGSRLLGLKLPVPREPA